MKDEFKVYGREKSPIPLKKLKTGDISAFLENGALRYICVSDFEIIRSVYSAVRTEGWLTAGQEIISEKITETGDGFEVLTKCRYRKGDADFEAEYSIVGKSGNQITLGMKGMANTSFKRCRIGFCVLHPLAGTKGNKCKIFHPDGSAEDSEFPLFVFPKQPFLNISGMEWEIPGLGKVSLTFKGEIFETEDHRNWTDASCKTYCTPLSLPYPVFIEKGTEIKQEIKIDFTPFSKSNIAMNQDKTTIRVSSYKKFDLPAIGVGKSSRRQKMDKVEAEIIKKAGFFHLRADLYTFKDNWEKELLEAIAEAEFLNSKLELALFVNDQNLNETLEKLSEISEEKRNLAENILVFHPDIFTTPASLWNSLDGPLRKVFPKAKIVAGTNANFAQLNFKRTDFKGFDALTFSIQPQEHAFDNLSLIENMAAQFDVVESARQFSDGKPVMVSPVNLQRRFNANVSHYEKPEEGNEMPWQVDTRIFSLFGAVWTCGSLLYLTKAGVSSVTYYETVGERGILQGNQPSQWLDKFPSEKNMIFPVYHVLKKFNDWRTKGYQMLDNTSTNPLQAEALLLIKENNLAGFLFNCSGSGLEVCLILNAENLNYQSLSPETYDSAANDPDFFNRLPYGKNSRNGNFIFAMQPHEIILFE
ncbi:MAG: hypothetical protein U0W24_19615 [Bacteroidales bacterium]